MKRQLLADRSAEYLSCEAREALRHAGVWIDQTKSATPAQLVGLLRQRDIEPTSAMIDVERNLGGATTRWGIVYGVFNGLLAEGDRRATSVCMATTGGAPCLYVSSRLQKHPERGLSWVHYDSAIHHIEVEYLVAPGPARHLVSFPSLLGNALADAFGLERFQPACGAAVTVWRGYDLEGNPGAAVELEPWPTAELDQEWTESYTGLFTESSDTVAGVLDWAERNKYIARWSGPKRQPKRGQGLTARYLTGQWTDVWRTDVETSVWGSPGNYCITRQGGREW